MRRPVLTIVTKVEKDCGILCATFFPITVTTALFKISVQNCGDSDSHLKVESDACAVSTTPVSWTRVKLILSKVMCSFAVKY